MITVIILIVGLMLGGLVGMLCGFALGADYERRQDAPAPDLEDIGWTEGEQ